MRPAGRAALTAALALVLTTGATRAQAPSAITLDQIMAALRGVRHVEARFVERRTLSVLRAPLQVAGILRFDAPDRLEKRGDPVDGRPGELLEIAGDQLTLARGGGAAPVMLSLRDHPEIGVLVDSIRATLAGDGAALERSFEVSASGGLGGWQLVLQPRAAAQRRMLAWMRVAGAGAAITGVDTQEADGDHSEMTITEGGR